MPFLYDPNLDPERERIADKNFQLAGAGQVMGGGTQPNVAAGPADRAPGAPTTSGAFSNLNKYLDANSGSNFGNKFSGRVNQDVNAANTAQQQAAAAFKQASDAGAVQNNETAINQALAAPTEEANQTEFKKYLNAQYQGPTVYQNHPSSYQQAYGATKRATDTAQAAGTEGGRFALLNNYFGTPTYNQGQKSLDNLLVQGNQQTQQALNQARVNANQAQRAFQAQGGELGDYAASNIAATDAAKDYARTQGTKAVGSERDAQQKAFRDADAQYQNYLQELATYNSGGYKAPADFQSTDWGLERTQDTDTGYWGIDPNEYITQGTAPTQSNVLSQDQQRKLNALESLMGESVTPYTAGEAYRPSDIRQDELRRAIAGNVGKYASASQALAKQRADARFAAQQRYNDILSSYNQDYLKGDVIRGSGYDNGYGAPDPRIDALLADLTAQEEGVYNQLNALRSQYGLGGVKGEYYTPTYTPKR